MRSLQFTQLPLFEVAVRLACRAPLPVTLTSVSKLFSRLGDRYPTVEDPPETESAPGRGHEVDFAFFGGTSAARFSGHALSLALTVRPQLVSLRWIRSAGDYPRYQVLDEELWRSVEDLKGTWGEAAVQFDVANMTYLNFIETSAATVRDILGQYFVAAVRPTLLPDDAPFHGVNLSWSDGGLDLRLLIEKGTAEIDGRKVQGYRLISIAGQRFGVSQDARTVVHVLHDRLQELFGSVISDAARKEWGYAGVAEL